MVMVSLPEASLGPLPAHHHAHGPDNDLKIEIEAEIADIVQIVAELFDHIGGGAVVAMVNLGPAGDTWPDHQPMFVQRHFFFELFDELGPLRPWSHQRHVAGQDMEELRKLIKPALSEQMPDGCNSRILLFRPHRSGMLFGVGDHGAQLSKVKWPAIPAEPLLRVEYGAG